MKLPKRVFNSPLIRYANFESGFCINLIKIRKPYADGRKYAISSHFKKNRGSMHKTLESALKRFKKEVEYASRLDTLAELNNTCNFGHLK